MTDQHIKVTPVRRAQIDIGKLVAGLLLLVQERAERIDHEDDAHQEPAA